MASDTRLFISFNYDAIRLKKGGIELLDKLILTHCIYGINPKGVNLEHQIYGKTRSLDKEMGRKWGGNSL